MPSEPVKRSPPSSTKASTASWTPQRRSFLNGFTRKPLKTSRRKRKNTLTEEEAAAEEADDLAQRGWQNLKDKAFAHDARYIDNWNDEIETLLFFSGLFSAVITAFIVETYRTLQPDQETSMVILLQTISSQLSSIANGTTFPPVLHPVQPDFQPAASSILVNALWFASLVCSLMAAFLGMLVRQWLRAYADGLGEYSPRIYARVRQFRYQGMSSWGVFDAIAIVPVILQIALILFFIGLVLFLLPLQAIIFRVVAFLVGLLLFIYLFTTIGPAFSSSCPYRSPQAHLTFLVVESVKSWSSSVRHTLRKRSLAKPSTEENRSPKNPMARSWEQREAIVKDDANADVDALVGIDSQLQDDDVLQDVHDLCFSALSGHHITTCVARMLQNRVSFRGKDVDDKYLWLAHSHVKNIMVFLPESILATFSEFVIDALDRAASDPAFAEYYLTIPPAIADSDISERWTADALNLVAAINYHVRNRQTSDEAAEEQVTTMENHFTLTLLKLLRLPLVGERSLPVAAFRGLAANPSLLLDLRGSESLAPGPRNFVKTALVVYDEIDPIAWVGTCLGISLLMPKETLEESSAMRAFLTKDIAGTIRNIGAHQFIYSQGSYCQRFASLLNERYPGVFEDSFRILFAGKQRTEKSIPKIPQNIRRLHIHHLPVGEERAIEPLDIVVTEEPEQLEFAVDDEKDGMLANRETHS